MKYIYPNLHKLFFEHVMPLSFALQAAQARGVLIDTDARDQLVKEYNQKISDVQKRINEIVGTPINCNSPKQIKELLYEKLRFPTIYKDGKITSDEDALLKLKRKYPDEEVLSLILQYRKDSKLVSTFLEVKTDASHRMHTSYNTSGAKSFRISSSQDLFGNGMNLQNIPAGKREGIANIRHMFIAGEDMTLVKGDLSQAETLVVARILCRYNDYTLWDRYVKDPNFDVHKWAAASIFNKNEKDVTPSERDMGKISNHSGNYCAGPMVIQSTAIKRGIYIDYDMARRIVDSRKECMPGLVKWWRDVEQKIRATRTLTTCFGRRRIFFGRFDDNAVIRDAVSFEPQSTVGDVCNTIFRVLYNQRAEYNGLPILQVHDEVVLEGPTSNTELMKRLMQQASIVPLYLNDNLEPLIIPIEIKSGKNWKM